MPLFKNGGSVARAFGVAPNGEQPSEGVFGCYLKQRNKSLPNVNSSQNSSNKTEKH